MTLSMHAASAPLFSRALKNMLAWLDKAEEHAKAKGFDVENFLGLRLAPDMFPLSRQVQIATDGAKNCVARLAGIEPPKWSDDETTLDELRARVRMAIEYVESIPASDIDGSEEREISMPAGPDHTLRFEGQAFLTGFSIPNFYFHVSMTYALLRQGGVALGKMDYLGPLDLVEAS
jgi:hypothetical protein